MALKKSELYSSLWSSCDELRGLDASQYKDYVLVLLFVKYVSDKYAGIPYAPITIPPGASFADMVLLNGKPDIGDKINAKILAPLATANKLSDMPDFNDPSRLGSFSQWHPVPQDDCARFLLRSAHGPKPTLRISPSLGLPTPPGTAARQQTDSRRGMGPP